MSKFIVGDKVTIAKLVLENGKYYPYGLNDTMCELSLKKAMITKVFMSRVHDDAKYCIEPFYYRINLDGEIYIWCAYMFIEGIPKPKYKVGDSVEIHELSMFGTRLNRPSYEMCQLSGKKAVITKVIPIPYTIQNRSKCIEPFCYNINISGEFGFWDASMFDPVIDNLCPTIFL